MPSRKTTVQCSTKRCENRGIYLVSDIKQSEGEYSCGTHLSRTMTRMGQSVYYVAKTVKVEAARAAKLRDD